MRTPAPGKSFVSSGFIPFLLIFTSQQPRERNISMTKNGCSMVPMFREEKWEHLESGRLAQIHWARGHRRQGWRAVILPEAMVEQGGHTRDSRGSWGAGCWRQLCLAWVPRGSGRLCLSTAALQRSMQEVLPSPHQGKERPSGKKRAR